jgi:hypothetical protein
MTILSKDFKIDGKTVMCVSFDSCSTDELLLTTDEQKCAFLDKALLKISSIELAEYAENTDKYEVNDEAYALEKSKEKQTTYHAKRTKSAKRHIAVHVTGKQGGGIYPPQKLSAPADAGSLNLLVEAAAPNPAGRGASAPSV